MPTAEQPARGTATTPQIVWPAYPHPNRLRFTAVRLDLFRTGASVSDYKCSTKNNLTVVNDVSVIGVFLRRQRQNSPSCVMAR